MDLGQGAAVGGMRLEISTGYSCYLIYNNFRHRMALQSNTEFNSYYLFSVILVFVCLCLCISPCICHCICLFYLYMPSKIFPEVAARGSAALPVASGEQVIKGIRGGLFIVSISDPSC